MTRNSQIAKMTTDDKPSVPRPTPDMDSLTNKYADESAKRFRFDGSAQYMELAEAQSKARQRTLKRTNAQRPTPNAQDGDSVKVLILGCAFSGLLHAVHQVEAGTDPDDIRLGDTASGFGGTWYWNRYPGLMVDVEASIYMPLLKETGHMPGHRFPYGPEMRRYIIHIAEK